jgi:hypothetical protein
MGSSKSRFQGSDKNVLSQACEVEDFFGSVLLRDSMDDWNLVKEIGELFVRIGVPAMGYALQARAHRHLRDVMRAHAALKECKCFVANGELPPAEEKLLVRLLAVEYLILNRPVE